ncbi:MAG: hypothetical protein HN341_19615 [Verrucomicrobia bacterium]|nr:hypothetical protein [Verrucomicrobiota bacterium]
MENGACQEHDDSTGFCGLPAVPDRPLAEDIDPNREALIRYVEKKWVNKTVLHYHFLENPTSWSGEEPQRSVVRDAFDEWKALEIGLKFEEVTAPNDAEVRIAFEPGGSWSYVGRDCIDMVSDPLERTMNFGWDLTSPYGRDTALHEIGHALGFPHEHQNPIAGIVWDEAAVYAYFGGYPNNWSQQKTYYNVLRKITPTAVAGSGWDRDSIMHYQFAAGLIATPEKYQTEPLLPAPGLSSVDIGEVRKFYPPESSQPAVALEPFMSQVLQISAGEQLDFVIRPEMSRKYVMQTFGAMDTVMVLFEDDNGTPVFLEGDDDSGWVTNASIRMRLIKGRTYYLRVRLYYAHAAGQGGIMLW